MKSFCVVTGLIICLALPAFAAQKPNILFIVADDLGWADVGWRGSRHKTPVLDLLVQEGVELDRHYVQPVCSPTRTALLSGRWTSRFGPHVLGPTKLRAFPPGTVTLAAALKSAGYATCLSGKWHLGSRSEWGPNHYDFDHTYGSLAGAADPWTHQYRPGAYAKTWHRDGKFLEEQGNATELVAAEAEKWIRTMPAPWFIYVPFQAVHIPVDAPSDYKALYAGETFHEDPAKNDAALRFAAFVSQMDSKVGQFIRALEQTGQRTNTLVVFHSDNGGLLQGGNAYLSKVAGSPVLSSNLPLRGQKAELYEGGVRVCALVNWPGKLSPRKVEAPLHAVDWMPTLTRLAGYRSETALHWDGRDIWPLLTGEQIRAEPRTIYIPARHGSALIFGEWKLISYKASKAPELFNLATDPYEKQDLASGNADRLKDLQARLAEVRRGDLAELPPDLKGVPDMPAAKKSPEK
jgi:arylsulfatase A-like enzyme